MSISRRAFLAGSALTIAARHAHAEPAVSAEPPRGGSDPWLEIDPGALAHNVRTISRLTSARPIIAVAKNNAYGCGIATVGPILERLAEVAGFAVVRAEEALALKRAGVKKPVLLMGPAARRLAGLRDAARAKGVSLGRLHAASSDTIARPTPETFLDAVRPGLMVYGGYPIAEMMARGELRPVYRLKARVIRVDALDAGEGVSYHRRFTATQPTRTATLALGHVDGYPSGAVKGCEVLIRGRLRPVIGTVSASHTVVSLGDDDSVRVGDEAIAVGPDDPAIHPNVVAKRAEWSEYNMFMHLNPALARRIRAE